MDENDVTENATLFNIEWAHVREMLAQIDAAPVEPAQEPFVTVNIEIVRSCDK